MHARILTVALTLALFTSAVAWADEKEDSAASEASARAKEFCDMLTGATLVGSFTVTHGEGAGPLGAAEALKEDRYKIDKVTQGKGDFFVFEARIQYEGKDQVFKMPVEVKWADDTPVITLTKILVPGLGTFTARILFYDDHYAGFWSGGDHGGHMFGRIERAKPEGDGAAEKSTEKSE